MRITTVDVETMNTAAILIAYTFAMIYERHARERKVAELISSLGVETEATQNDSTYYSGGDEQHRQKQQAAPKKHGGEKTILKLGEPGSQHAEKPQEGDTGKWHQVQRNCDRCCLGGEPGARLSGSAGIEVRSSHRIANSSN